MQTQGVVNAYTAHSLRMDFKNTAKNGQAILEGRR